MLHHLSLYGLDRTTDQPLLISHIFRTDYEIGSVALQISLLGGSMKKLTGEQIPKVMASMTMEQRWRAFIALLHELKRRGYAKAYKAERDAKSGRYGKRACRAQNRQKS